MSFLPGFNKSTVYNAHSVFNKCPVSNPEKPTAPPVESFDDELPMQGTQDDIPEIEAPVVNVDLFGWVMAIITMAGFSFMLFMFNIARNKAIHYCLKPKNHTVENLPGKVDSDKSVVGNISGWWNQMFFYEPTEIPWGETTLLPKKSGGI